LGISKAVLQSLINYFKFPFYLTETIETMKLAKYCLKDFVYLYRNFVIDLNIQDIFIFILLIF